jgi:type III secretion system HrpB1/HrpK family protein
MLNQLDKQRPELADALIALIGVALSREADQLAQPMFDLVKILRPEAPQLDAFQGWFCLRQGDVMSASRHLRSAVDVLGDKAGTARTLLAMVLCAQGDPAWLTHAKDIIADGQDQNSVALLKTLMNNGSIPMSEPGEEGHVEALVTATAPVNAHESNAHKKHAIYLRA